MIYKRADKDRVYCNRSVDLTNIKFYGFDMDYTLAVYNSPDLEIISFVHSKNPSRHPEDSCFLSLVHTLAESSSRRCGMQQHNAAAPCSSTMLTPMMIVLLFLSFFLLHGLVRYDLVVRRLVEIGYPEEMLQFKFDPEFPIRGLFYDNILGNLLKVSLGEKRVLVKMALLLVPVLELNASLLPSLFDVRWTSLATFCLPFTERAR